MACLSPNLSLTEATITSAVFSISYVAVLYLPFNSGPRNATPIIVSRLLTLSLLTCLLETYIRIRLPVVSYHHSTISHITATLIGIGLTLLLYAGHILVTPIRNLTSHSFAEHRYQALRNYFFAPLLEEIVFRRQTLLIWSCQHPASQLIFPALMFSLAHAHRFRSMGLVPLLFQLAYTLLFGVYAAALYINTLSVFAPIGAHILCNILELPDVLAMATHRKRRAILIVYAASLLCFAIAFLPVTRVVRPAYVAFR